MAEDYVGFCEKLWRGWLDVLTWQRLPPKENGIPWYEHAEPKWPQKPSN
jgi:hypothetical protein